MSASTARTMFSLLFLGYHKLFSPLLPAACRFYPSCSIYASQAVQKHGILRGISLSVRRLSRCHPWSAGGYDPVN